MAPPGFCPDGSNILKRPASIPAVAMAILICLICTVVPWLYSAGAGLLILASPSSDATEHSVAAEWHAPADWSVNNLTTVLEAGGVFGFIFNSSHTPDSKYGTYNYCNMPHVRAKEYVKPSDEYELKYVELIHRHHKRSPYADNSFPVESYEWNCNDQSFYSYAEPHGGHRASHGYRKVFTSQLNPFRSPGFIGDCQFPQITAQGLDDSWLHGADLFGVYHDLLHFLPGRTDDFSSKVKYRASNSDITHQVAGMIINAMWGSTEGVPLHLQANGIDSLLPQYSCPSSSRLLDNIKSARNPSWREHLVKTQELISSLDDISGVPTGDNRWHQSFDPYFDNLSSRQCHDKPLPCKVVDGVNTTVCVTEEMANGVYRLGQWEYSQMYRDAPESLALCGSSFGVWIAELSSHIRGAMDGTSDTLYFHNVAHDGSVSRILSILQVDEMVWPGMGAEVLFELYKKRHDHPVPEPTAPPPGSSDGGFYVRVLFNGRVFKSSSPVLGSMDMVPVETFLGYLESLSGRDAREVMSKCNS